MRAAGAVLRKDLRLELRTGETVPAMALFSLTTFVLFRFGLQRTTLAGATAAGVLLVTLLLAAVLGTVRLFVSEREEGGLDGFLLAPVDRTALFVAKALALFGYLVLLEIVLVPAFVLLLLGPTPDLAGFARLVLVLALADAGVAVVGTLVGALAIQTRARDLLVPLLALPLLLPVVIALAKATTPLFAEAGAGSLPGRWLAVLGLYDLVFGLLAYGLFDFLVED
jgi:heme exporter protein B